GIADDQAADRNDGRDLEGPKQDRGIEPTGQRLCVPFEAASRKAQGKEPAEWEHEQQQKKQGGGTSQRQRAERKARSACLPGGGAKARRGSCRRERHRRHSTSISRASA